MPGVQTNNTAAVPPPSYLQDLAGAYSVFAGFTKGGTAGDTSAALAATQLAAKNNLLGSSSSNIGTAASDLGAGIGLVEGIEQGGVEGYGTAAVSGLRLASSVGGATGLLSSGVAADLSSAASDIAAPLALYNEISTWQSGATGSDALAGAESGAAVGSIVPGIGTAIGAVVGAAVGALSSLFGGGKTDPESLSLSNVTKQYTAAYNEDPTGAQQALSQMSPAQSFQLLAGAFDAKNDTPGHSQPLEQALGRMGEGTFLTDMAGKINSAVSSGQIAANATPGQVYASVVQPWITSITNGQGILGGQNGEGGVLTGAVQNLIGAYMGGQLTSSTPIGVSGQAATTLPAFAGAGAPQAPASTLSAPAIQGATSAVLSFPGTSSSSGTGSMLPVLLASSALMGAAGSATGASGMSTPDPFSGAPSGVQNTSIQGADPNASPTGAASSTSSLGSDLSSLGGDITSFLSSPTGELAEFGTIAGLGISQANSQAATNTQLSESLGTLGTPFSGAGAAELGQITGGPSVGGPLGASITQQTGAAANLGQVAQEYSTGQLTPAQQQQVSDYTAQQTAQLKTQLASSGNTDSSALDAGMQQINNNAAQLTQSLVSGNTTMATQALTAVQATYSNILNQSLSDAAFGFGAQEAAVQTQIQSNTALSASLNALFSALAQGIGTALGGNKTTTPAGAAGTSGAPSAATTRGVASSAAGGGSPMPGSAAATGTLGNSPFQPETTAEAAGGDQSEQVANDQELQGLTQNSIPDLSSGFSDTSSDPMSTLFDTSSSSSGATDYLTDPWS
jgi:hypothetical protein